MSNIKLTLIILCAWQLCQAQTDNTYFHHLTVENGLSEATNFYFYKDSRGFVWISSISGLNRFDGRQIRVYQSEPADTNTLYGQNIQSPFYEDMNGDIWFSTNDAVNRYVRKQDIFKHYYIQDTLTQKKVASYYVAHLDLSSQLWVLVGESAIYVFDTKTERFIKKNNVEEGTQRLNVQTDTKNKVIRAFTYTWASFKKGLQKTDYLDNGMITQENLFHTHSTNPLSIHDILVEKDSVWLCTNKGIHQLNLETKQIKDYYLKDSLISLSKLNNNQFLVTSFNKGLSVFNKSNSQLIQKYNHFDSYTHSIMGDKSFISSVDGDNGIWLQQTKGVDFTLISKKKFKTLYLFPFDKTLKTSFDATALIVDKEGFLWSGSNGTGIRHFGKDGFVNQSFNANTSEAKGLKNNTALVSFLDKQNRVWFLGNNYLGFFDKVKSNFQNVDLHNLSFLFGLTTHADKILIATYTGVFEIKEPQNGKFQFEKIKNIPFDKPHSIIFEDNEGLIWGSYDAVYIRIYDPLKNYELVKELPINGLVTGFWQQPNTQIVWMSSQNGLFKIDKSTWQSKLYTEANGLPSRTINSMLADDAGHLWLGTSKGLAQFDPSSRDSFGTVEKVHSYNLVDGISDLNFNMFAATKAPDGTLYFGTSNGITTFNPKDITPLSIQARPTITNILINEKVQPLICTKTGATNVSEIHSLELQYSENTISLTFAAMEYSDPMRCQFQFKMEGVDKDWVEAGTLNSTRYADLKAGTYNFLLKASNSDGVWAEKPKILEITIIPPFWKTAWFITLCILAGMALFGYIIYLRLSKTIDLQEVRIKLYENLHDDLGSRLTAIVLTIDQILMKRKDALLAMTTPSVIEAETRTLTDTKDIARSIVSNMRRLVWATAPENDELSNVMQQMTTDARILLSTTVTFNTHIAEPLLKLKVDGNKRYQMLSIVNEALTNIAKYADATLVTVSIERVGDNLCQTISDNGKGFDPQQPLEDKPNSGGHGLVNMSRRAKRINGTLNIESEKNKGTTIRVCFPLASASFLQRFWQLFTKSSLK